MNREGTGIMGLLRWRWHLAAAVALLLVLAVSAAGGSAPRRLIASGHDVGWSSSPAHPQRPGSPHQIPQVKRASARRSNPRRGQGEEGEVSDTGL